MKLMRDEKKLFTFRHYQQIFAGILVLTFGLTVFFGSSQKSILNYNKMDIEFYNAEISLTRLKQHTAAWHENSLCSPSMTIVFVACGLERLQREALNSMQSVLMFTNCSAIHFVLFTDASIIEKAKEFIMDLISAPLFQRVHVHVTVKEALFPGVSNKTLWENMYSRCSTMRLFLPSILSDMDAVIYADTDTLFVSPVEKLWAEFEHMNDSQIIAMVQEHEDIDIAWYPKHSRVPFVLPFGVNSGLLLMNLTRMRMISWEPTVLSAYDFYQANISFPDQDILNILFRANPDKLMKLSCKWNFRRHHCGLSGQESLGQCISAVRDAPALLHGNSKCFYSTCEFENRFLSAIHLIFLQFNPDLMDITNGFLIPLNRTFDEIPKDSACTQLFLALANVLETTVHELYQPIV